MEYTKQNFESGQVLTAEHMNHIEEGISQNTEAINNLSNKTTSWNDLEDKPFYEKKNTENTTILEAGDRTFICTSEDLGIYEYYFTEDECAALRNIGVAEGTLRLVANGVTYDNHISLNNGSFDGISIDLSTDDMYSRIDINEYNGGYAILWLYTPAANIELIFIPDAEIIPIPEKYIPNTIATKEFVQTEGMTILYPDEGDSVIYANRVLPNSKGWDEYKTFVLTADMYMLDPEVLDNGLLWVEDVDWENEYIPAGSLIIIGPIQEVQPDPDVYDFVYEMMIYTIDGSYKIGFGDGNLHNYVSYSGFVPNVTDWNSLQNKPFGEKLVNDDPISILPNQEREFYRDDIIPGEIFCYRYDLTETEKNNGQMLGNAIGTMRLTIDGVSSEAYAVLENGVITNAINSDIDFEITLPGDSRSTEIYLHKEFEYLESPDSIDGLNDIELVFIPDVEYSKIPEELLPEIKTSWNDLEDKPFGEVAVNDDITIMKQSYYAFRLTDSDLRIYEYSFTDEMRNILISLGTTTGTLRMNLDGDIIEHTVSLDNGSLVGSNSIRFKSERIPSNYVDLGAYGLTTVNNAAFNMGLVFIPDSEIIMITPISEKYIPNTIATKTYVNNGIKNNLENYYTKTEVNNLFNSIVNGDEVSY